MQIDFTEEPNLSVETYAEVLIASGFDPAYPVHDKERLARILMSSDIIVTARDRGHLVGVARALTDFEHCGYLCDLMVIPSFRRQGVGRQLVKEVKRLAGDCVSLVTLAGPEAGTYYAELGFEPRINGWILKRTS